MPLFTSFGTISNRSLTTSAITSDVYISGNVTTIVDDIYTIQSITITVTENYQLTMVDNNHDIYQISYNFDISPSIILPDNSTISNGYKATLVNTNFLSIDVSVYDNSTDKISTWNTTAVTSFTLPPHMVISLIYLDSIWYSSIN